MVRLRPTFFKNEKVYMGDPFPKLPKLNKSQTKPTNPLELESFKFDPTELNLDKCPDSFIIPILIKSYTERRMRMVDLGMVSIEQAMKDIKRLRKFMKEWEEGQKQQDDKTP